VSKELLEREEEEKMRRVELQKQRLDQMLEAKRYLGTAWHSQKRREIDGNRAKLRPDTY
jgi:hypothetical protein